VHTPNPGYLQPGTKIGAYEIAGLVGSGGFGFVYRVTRDSRPYALKISKWRGDDLDPEDRGESEKRLDREISALMSFRHPNIVRVHGFERWPSLEDGFPYLVMDFVEGEHLNAWRKKTSPTLRRACQALAAIADALGYIHRCGVFHRDLKSENVLMRSDGSPVIVDFGISRLREADPVTRIGSSLGTITHYAPEYAEFVASPSFEGGSFEWRAETDLHALGYISYELLTGSPPFPKASRAMVETQLLHLIRTHVPAAPSVRTGGLVPASLDEIVMRLLAKSPGDRYASGDEVALAIRRAARDGGPAWDEPLRLPTEDLTSAPTPRWTRPPGTAPGAPAPAAAAPRDPPPASAPVPLPVEPRREGDYEIVELDSSTVETETESPDQLGRVQQEGPAASADEVRRDPAALVPAAPRRERAALPKILVGMGALVLLGFLAYVLVAKPSPQPSPSGAGPSVAAEDGRGAAPAPSAPTQLRPDPAPTPVAPPQPSPEPFDGGAERSKEDRPVATSPLGPEQPAAAGARPREEPERPSAASVRPHEERRERERQAKLARERAARQAAEHEKIARAGAERVVAVAQEHAEEDSNPGLGNDQIQAVVSSAQGAFEKCVETERQKSGKSRQVRLDGRRVMLRINIQPTGKISYPTFDDVTLRGTELGSCLLDVAKGMTFPAFKGEVPPVDVPLVLRE
jgi:serine/threonine protein kinase